MIIYSNNSEKTKTDVSYVNCDLGGYPLLICLISPALILSQLVSKVIFQIITLRLLCTVLWMFHPISILQ